MWTVDLDNFLLELEKIEKKHRASKNENTVKKTDKEGENMIDEGLFS